ncbi:MAG: DUF1854 domain-containing protein [Hydrogenophaga sp.]|uniref:cyanophycin metabolism-associated DUF1854 family protein n=1 Tax=Hydrogenophaga sp. TaxID=1904254 RepID=UPI00271B1EE2|nr:DUF1854 domain-containing protein [Hydrogenophaga sp.]MDO9506462.1 DUF1854 domain-containing protein [Hydrogenophaga sp.]MDP2985886.1 DUF1854 domain-containing protein [Hydrogenophaga sp.]MDP3203591.1 DUF1854 domain-containing protein [Hydrogenophaga sp.]MDP3625607.1 DUF1854 domain-containing protein [Hydrogenophaga sp.]
MNTSANAMVDFELFCDTQGSWVCRVAGGEPQVGVQVVRAFPLSAPDEAISIVGPDGHETVFVARLDALDDARRAAVAQALSQREFSPVIQRIREVSSFGTPSTWQVDTDRGPTELVLKVEEDIRRLPGQRRLLITSAHGVVFDIPDRNRLDRTSRRFLERFL